MTQNETKKVRDPIKKWLQSEGWRVWRNTQSTYSEAGISDLMALKNGRFVAVETKDKGKKATKLQERFIADMRSHGASLAIVVDSLSSFQNAMRDAGLAQ